MFYASCYGIPEQYEVLYALPGRKTSETKRVTPATIEAVRNSVFAHFSNPPLKLELMEEQSTALMTVETFIYYDKVDYFRNFMDSSFLLIRKKESKTSFLTCAGIAEEILSAQ
ncbi:MAG: hypothetical protein R2758_00590 [Bacteroidales bacterium]